MTSSGPEFRKTTMLLQRWHDEDREALSELLNKHLPYIRSYVQKKATPTLLARFDVDDIVQETASQILLFTPNFQVRDGEHFRALLARMVFNSISEKWKYLTAMRRDIHREAQIPSGSVLSLHPQAPSACRPSRLAVAEEERTWVRLALELLTDTDRIPILLRDWGGKSFQEIGEEIGLQTDAARMRYGRALLRLGSVVKALRSGQIPPEGSE